MPDKEFGDFQTPLQLAEQCLGLLMIPDDARVLEPTCGEGAFLRAAEKAVPGSERRGLELRQEYVEIASQWGTVEQGNIFEKDLSRDVSWESDGSLFVVGNPPWVTSSELGRISSENLPPKENFKKAKGLDAVLGSSNFDVCEYIILKALTELRSERFTLGMLCKTQVARNVMQYASENGLPIAGSEIYRIDALKWFNAGVDACWFIAVVDPLYAPDYTTDVHDDVFAPGGTPSKRFGVVDGLFVSDVDKYREVEAADGRSPFVWRSGLKHDASSIFELKATPAPETKAGQRLDIEEGYVFPLLKCTDIFRDRTRELTRWVIVPQRSFGESTEDLAERAPRLSAYLDANAEALDRRKSSIYRGRPRFSVFGHGPYTYGRYKVAVSGLHKEARFRLVAPIDGKPVVLDDTCYFVPFDRGTEAAVAAALLNSEQAQALIESLVFWDAKRPITKRLLARLDVGRLPVDDEAIIASAEEHARAAGVEFDRGVARGFLAELGRSGSGG